MQDDESLFDRAAKIYAARLSLREAKRPPNAVGVAELYRAITEPDVPLTPQITQALFISDDLRAVFRTVTQQRAVRAIPAMAAASDQALAERRLEGGVLRLTPARRGGQIYLLVQLQPPWPEKPLSLLLMHPTKPLVVKKALPACDDEGELMVVLDLSDANDANLLSAIEDPMFEGALL